MQKRAQLTLFVLLGLVLLIVFLFLMAFANRFNREKMDNELNAVIADLLQTTNINYEVQICLKQTIEQGLELMGRQGGVLYVDQGGLTLFNAQNVFPIYNVSNTTFIVTNLTYINNVAYPLPPLYPFPGPLFPPLPLPPQQPRPTHFWGLYWPYFGKLQLPYLCQPGGPNDVRINPRVTAPCETGFYGNHSMQEQLQRYTENNIQECTNFTFLRNMTQYEVEIGKPNVTIILGIANLFANTTYPLQLSIGGKKTLRHVSFQTILPVRLRKFYTFLSALFTLDTSYVNFTIPVNYRTLTAAWDQYLGVQKYCPSCVSGMYTDIIVITDRGSDLSGKPFVFMVAIKNRGPALDLIQKGDWPPYPKVNVVAHADETIRLKPRGYDPDEDQLNYTYSGWKENYDGEFDEECCMQDFQVCLDSLFRDCVTRNPTVSPRWSTSNAYVLTKQNAEMPVHDTDVGFHVTRITVEDDASAEDWQDVGILVLPNHLGSYQCAETCTQTCTITCACDQSYGASAACQGVNLQDVDASGGSCNDATNTYCQDCSRIPPNAAQEACQCDERYWVMPEDDAGPTNGCCNSPLACIKNDQCFLPGNIYAQKHYCKDLGAKRKILTCTPSTDCMTEGSFWCDSSIPAWEPLPIPAGRC